MTGNERQRLQEGQLQEEIAELRGELGETVEALVHKADLPTRAKERGAELAEQAVDRGVELHQQVVERGNEWRDRAIGVAERARAARPQTLAEAPASRSRWTMLALAGLALVAMTVIIRRVRAS
ncbi:MAG TPA: DUF3618 domain-containing protein [Pseudonocardiaceae bacterium]|nr:DUF3618 domain-containing protein [Pseudonocardiaceae bacterium]